MKFRESETVKANKYIGVGNNVGHLRDVQEWGEVGCCLNIPCAMGEGHSNIGYGAVARCKWFLGGSSLTMIVTGP